MWKGLLRVFMIKNTTSRNPVLDFYIMAHTAGVLHRPVYEILEMPSRDGKSLTSFRFAQIENVLHLAGDTTTQGFRNAIHKLHKQQKDRQLVLIIVEDASKIRHKVREDFFALCAQFMSGTVNVDQSGMDFSFKTHASVIINCPPFFTKTLEYYLTNSGCGDRYDKVSTGLSDKDKLKLKRLGDYNMPLRVLPVDLPDINIIPFPDYADQNKRYGSNLLNCRYACKCAGLDENLVEAMKNNTLKSIDWSGYWEEQITPPEWQRTVLKKEQGGEHR